MSESNSADLTTQLDALLQKRLAELHPGAAPAWGRPAAGGQPQAIHLRVRIPTAAGDVSGYLQIPLPEGITPQALPAFVEQVGQQWPLDAWQPRQNQNYGNGGYGGGGGWQGRRGYGGGGYGGRRW